MNRPLALGAYALTALLLGGYALVMWWVIHPSVPANYRAYYIDQTTTCMDQPVSGTYTVGTLVSFLPDGADAAKPLKPCGWEGPTGDGTHAVGTSARLRFAWGDTTIRPATLALDLKAITKAGMVKPQTVEVLVDDRKIATIEVISDTGQHFDIKLPADLAAQGRAEILLQFPDAVQMGQTDPATRWRSVKLLSAGLLPG